MIVLLTLYFLKQKKSDPANTAPIDNEIEKDSGSEIQLTEKTETTAEIPVPEKPDEDILKTSESNAKTASVHPGKLKYTDYYAHPLDGPLYLSGTFGELRNNHFHAGLDIRTGGVQGKEVKAVASGYVSRIKVSTRGYGKAIYIQHPNGTTSVYGHLKKYSGAIQDAVIARQYALEKYEFEWYVPARKLKVAKGQVIALSGNTGGSGGPHLHFEIRDKRGKTVNPLLYGIQVTDNIKPFVKSCRVYHLEKKRSEEYGIYGSTRIKKGVILDVKPGTYGIGTSWVDYFSDKMNRLGVNYAELRIDGKTIFTQKIEDFAFDQGRYINAHIDFWRYSATGIRYVKMFKDHGNALHFYSGKGQFKVDNDQHVKVEIIATDFSGKTDGFSFTLHGKEGILALKEGGTSVKDNMKCSHKSGHTLKTAGATLYIPKGALYQTTYIGLTQTPATGKAVSPMIRVSHANVALHKSATIKIKIPSEVASKKNKLVMMSYNKKTRGSSYEGGKVAGSYVTETFKNLGIFYLALDTVPPTVTALKYGSYLSFRVNDAISKIDTYTCRVDGDWVLLEYEPKSNKLFGTLPKSYKTGKHELVLTVYDSAGNKTEIKKTINI